MGRNLYGVVDEYDVLEYNEVYIQYSIRGIEDPDTYEPVTGTEILQGSWFNHTYLHVSCQEVKTPC